MTLTPTGAPSSGYWSIDFGQVSVGAQVSSTIFLQDEGAAPLEVLSVGAPSDAEFSLALSAGDVAYSCQGDAGVIQIPLFFKPFNAGSKSGVVVVQTDSQAIPTITLILTGTGVQ
jgi:hypothetical protein